MWLLVNPALEDEIDAAALHQFVKSLAEIAVMQTRQYIEMLEVPVDPVKRIQSDQCQQYLLCAEGKLVGFLNDFEASLPVKLSYSAFSRTI